MTKTHELPTFLSETLPVELIAELEEAHQQGNSVLLTCRARRIGIARALALHLRLLVADEPTAGLDVSVAAGILNLLKDLRQQFDLTYIIITHNLNVISFIADRVAVMYLGKVVELAAAETLFTTPRHPYTQALLSANPVPDPERCHDRQRIHLKGEIPSPRNPPPGCAFHTRCMYAQPNCALQPPQLKSAADTGGMVACHYPLEVNISHTIWRLHTIMKKLVYLTPDEVEAAHQATLQILSEVDVKLTHPTARDLLTSHGASLAGNRVLFPPDLVMDCLGKCPPIVRLGERRVKSPEDLSLYTAHCAGIIFT